MNSETPRPEHKGPALSCFKAERKYQEDKHGFTTEWQRQHPEFYQFGQLLYAARQLANLDADLISSVAPTNWDNEWWLRLTKKSLKDRLIIAGTFIAAHYDYAFDSESE